MIMPFGGKTPSLHPSVFVAPGAHVIGDVRIGARSSVWFSAVLRGDLDKIRIGRGVNIQDGSVVHVDWGKGCTLKDGVIVGHQAVVHACTIEEGVLIGIGARILSGAHIGAYSLVGAGAVVREDAVIPPHSLVLGVPGKVVRTLGPKEAAAQREHARRYSELAARYKKFLG